MSPNNNIGFRNMAGIYYYLGDINNAIYFTKLSINIQPSDKAYTNLGTMLFSIKNYNESIIAYKKSIELNGVNYITWGNLADAYKLTNNKLSLISYQTAIKNVKNILTINSKDTKAMAHISYYLANINQVKKALHYTNQIGEENTGLENFIVATAYDVLKMTKMALIHIKIAINKNYPKEEILITPLLKSTRHDIRFNEMVK
jgi:tetratricopeptide (TPR) repeat protein